jgi:ketosteroid isomerase-like protein
MPSRNVEVVRTALEGYSAGTSPSELGERFDLGVSAGLIHPEHELIPARDLGGGMVYRGREGWVEFMGSWIEDFEDWTFELEEIIEGPGDRVVAVITQRGIGKGSRVPVELRHSAVHDLKDGRVVRSQLFLDPKEAYAAAGLPEGASDAAG